MTNMLKTLMNRNSKQKLLSGFTLAETLITLTIIGVVAAITIPVAYSNYQKEITATRLKKVFSEINQAITYSIAENGSMSRWNFNLGQADFFDKYLKRYIVLKNEKFLDSRTANNITYYQISGQPETGLAIFWRSNDGHGHDELNSTRYLYLMSGAQIIIANDAAPDDSEYSARGLYVDINGFKKPNTFGKDVFVININKEHGVYFARKDDNETYEQGAARTLAQLKNGPSNYQYQCNKQGRGMWCGAVIQASGWKIPDDYPWK